MGCVDERTYADDSGRGDHELLAEGGGRGKRDGVPEEGAARGGDWGGWGSHCRGEVREVTQLVLARHGLRDRATCGRHRLGGRVRHGGGLEMLSERMHGGEVAQRTTAVRRA